MQPALPTYTARNTQ